MTGREHRRLAAGLCAAALIALAGCGGGSKPARPTTPASVVRAWADALRAGHVDQATRLFAVPALVANGGPPVKLTTRAEIRFFNESLPCGARVASTERGPRGFTIVTFVLTERPGGGDCRGGVGSTARTAFRIRNGRITDWLRVEDIPSAPAAATKV